jgi:hypothetical protein
VEDISMDNLFELYQDRQKWESTELGSSPQCSLFFIFTWNPCLITLATLLPVINSVQNSGDFPLVDPIGILTAGGLYPILP